MKKFIYILILMFGLSHCTKIGIIELQGKKYILDIDYGNSRYAK
tara:strand:+ start:1341 stop:1472 length:132 start_codon:yes stop_codon:yes gene_type:complete